MSTKGSLSVVWIVSLSLLTLLATGCNVSSSGLGSLFDAADGPRQTLDAQSEDARDASSLLFEAGHEEVPDSAPDGLPDRAPNPATDAVLWDTTGASSDHGSSPDGATAGQDAVLEDGRPPADVPLLFEVDTPPDGPLVRDGQVEQGGLDGIDGLPPPPIDGPVTLPVDAPALDSTPVDATPSDGVPRDQAQDPPALPDLPAPDLAPADVGPHPTINWVIDNTTSIGGFTPTVLGSPTVTAMDAGTAVCFDGTRDGLLLATNPIQGMQRFTIETLVYPEFTSTSTPRLIHIGGSAATSPRLIFQMVGEASGAWHALIGFYSAGAQTDLEDTTYSHPSNQWYWLAVTYDGQTARVYVNGVLENSSAFTFNPMATGSTSLGTRLNGQYYFPGCMRDVEFFNSALPASQLDKP